MTAQRRIQKELSALAKDPVKGITVDAGDDIFEWACALKANPDSPYNGGTFKFLLTFPRDFPFKPPTVAFKTKIYHPGIDANGSICVAVLRDEWKPAMTMSSVLTIIRDKVNDPSPDDPFDLDIAKVLRSDRAKFLETARAWTQKHAKQA